MEIWKIAERTTSIPLDDMKSLFLDSVQTGQRRRVHPQYVRTDVFSLKLCFTFGHFLRIGGCKTAQTFFGRGNADYTLNGKQWTSKRDEFSVAYIAWHISKTSLHGFNKMIKGDQSESTWKNWINASAKSLGINYFFQLQRNKYGWDDIVKNRKTYLPKIHEKMCNSTFATGEEISHFIALPNYLPLKVMFLVVSEIDDESQSTLKQLEKVFQDTLSKPHWDAIKDWRDLNMFNGMDAALNVLHFLAEVQKACKVDDHSSQAAKGGYFTYDVWGTAVESWVKQGCYSLSHLFTGHHPDNIDQHFHNTLGCFLDGTKITTLDGDGRMNSKRIETISHGDRILCADGRDGMVSEESSTPKLDRETKVYGINDEVPFFIACHPLWTPTGWKALDPVVAQAENPWLIVSQLRRGDLVYRLREGLQSVSCKDMYEVIKIQRFNSKIVSNTKVYGIHLREGLRSYHANGFLVALNYPEFTPQRFNESLQLLPIVERGEILKDLPRIQVIADIAFGQSCEKINFTDPSSILAPSKGLKTDRFEQINVNSYTLHSPTTSTELPSLSVIHSWAFLNNKSAMTTYICGSRVCWKRSREDGCCEFATVQFSPGYLLGRGVLVVSDNENLRQLDPGSIVPFTVTKTLKFHCTVFRVPNGEATVKPESSFALEVGCSPSSEPDDYPLNLEASITSYSFSSDMEGIQAFAGIDGDDGLCVVFTANDGTTSCKYSQGKIKMATHYQSIHGEFILAANSERLGVIGTVDEEAQLQTMILDSNFEGLLKRKGVARKYQNSDPTPPQLLNLVAKEIGIAELLAIPAVNMAIFYENVTAKLVKWAKSFMNLKWFSMFFDGQRPKLISQEIEQLSHHRDYLGKFGLAYLILLVQQRYRSMIDRKESNGEKIEIFWSTAGSDSVVAVNGYSQVLSLAIRSSFLELVDDKFHSYLQGSRGPAAEQWSHDLLQISTTSFLNNLKAQVKNGMRSQFNMVALELFTLNPREPNWNTLKSRVILEGELSEAIPTESAVFPLEFPTIVTSGLLQCALIQQTLFERLNPTKNIENFVKEEMIPFFESIQHEE